MTQKPPRKSAVTTPRKPSKGSRAADTATASTPAAAEPDARAKRVSARLSLQRATRRPRKPAPDDDGMGGSGRLFISALARGLEVLNAFKAGDRALGNLELAERTGLPKPTISRITHTLTTLGYLDYDSRRGSYELGGRTMALSYIALANLDIRRIARPIMAAVADASNLHIALGMRDGLTMLNVETCDGHGLVGLRLANGSHVPISVTALGKAYLAAAAEDDRRDIMDAIKREHGKTWPAIRRAIDDAKRDIAQHGFCLSIAEWRKDINAVGAPIVAPDGAAVYALSLAGPAYLFSQDELERIHGPALAVAARQISAMLGGCKP